MNMIFAYEIFQTGRYYLTMNETFFAFSFLKVGQIKIIFYQAFIFAENLIESTYQDNEEYKLDTKILKKTNSSLRRCYCGWHVTD